LNGGAFTPAVGTKTVTAAANLTINASNALSVSATHLFVTGDQMKFLMVTAGTGWIVGLYQVITCDGTNAILDRSPVTSIAAATGHSGTYDLYDGIDYSQQNAAQVVLDNSTITTSVTTNVITFTGSTHATVATEVGNFVHLATGTNVAPGWYQITAVSVAANNGTWTLNGNAVSSGTSTDFVGKMGGALQTIAQAASIYVSSNKIFVKAEATIVKTATITFSVGTAVAPGVPFTRLIGYTSARTDNGKVTIQLSTNTGLTGLSLTGAGLSVENFIVDCNTLGTSTGISLAGNENRAINCVAKNATTAGIACVTTGACTVYKCEVTGCTSAATAAINVTITSQYIYGCNIHDNACPGIVTTAQLNILNNLITNNTGASSDGINIGTSGTAGSYIVSGNTIYGSGRDGIRSASGRANAAALITNNILASNVGYGCNFSSAAGIPSDVEWDGNAYYNNTTGTRHFMDDAGGTNVINGVSPYLNPLDILVTAGSPFTNAAGGDFTLNSTANQGALIRGVGVPASYPNATGTNNRDMGAFQHADPAATGGGSSLML
jgi:hypothetical protein